MVALLGASDHLTNDRANIQDNTFYSGHENVTAGNGSLLPVTHFDTSIVALHFCSLTLPHVLHILGMSHNMLFVQKFFDNNKIVKFHTNDFFC